MAERPYFHFDPATNPISYPPGTVDLTQDYFKEASGLLENDFNAKDLLELILKMDEWAVPISVKLLWNSQ